MSLKIEDYLSAIEVLSSQFASTRKTSASENALPESDAAAGSTAMAGSAVAAKGTDSYIASGVDSSAAIPCDTYNDILDVMRSAKAQTAENNTPPDFQQAAGSTQADGSAQAGGTQADGSAQAAGGSGTQADGSAQAGGTQAAGSAQAAGGSGTQADGSGEDETETEVVVINGIRYLEITTTSGGITTVTRTVLGTEIGQEDSKKDTVSQTSITPL